MKRISLSKNMRAQKDSKFSEFLLRVGNGEEQVDVEGNIRIPEEIIVKYDNEEESKERRIDAIFPNLKQSAESSNYMIARAILAAKNKVVD